MTFLSVMGALFLMLLAPLPIIWAGCWIEDKWKVIKSGKFERDRFAEKCAKLEGENASLRQQVETLKATGYRG